jgi:hypothetical protein
MAKMAESRHSKVLSTGPVFGQCPAAVVRCVLLLATLAALCVLRVDTAAPAHAAAATLPGSCGASAGTARLTSASVPVSATGARISLNTASAVAGTQIVVRGTGWPAGVLLSVDVEHFVETGGSVSSVTALHGLAKATTTSTGTFTAPMFRLPRGMCGMLPQAGTIAEIVAHTPDGGIQATAALSIAQTPMIEVVLPSSTPPGGTSIPVSGSAWVPGTFVSLVAAGFPPACQGVSANDSASCVTPLSGAQPVNAVAAADGTFRTNVPIPPGVLPGTLMTIRAAVSASPYGELVLRSDWEAQQLPNVAPTLTLDHASGPAGATVVVMGDHWPESERVVVSYCRSEAMSQTTLGPQCNQGAQGLVVTGYAEELGEADTDASGHFALQVVLPANARPGAIAFEARLASQTPAADVYVQMAAFTITVVTAGSRPSARLGWSFAVGSAVVFAVLALTGILVWRRRLRLRVARSIR